jgi:AcrR family transcriptional regulator
MERSRPPAARTPAEPRRRTGGRSARVVHDVLAAAVDELARSGYAALSFDAVAARAGVSRTTVYRRWPTKPDLVRAALLRLAEEHTGQPPDTGALREDLLELVRRRLAANVADRDAGLTRVLMAEVSDPEVAALARVVRTRFQAPIVLAVERAIARGELPRGTDPLLVLEPITATMHLKVAVFRDVLEPGFVEALVDLVIAGARSGAAVRTASTPP